MLKKIINIISRFSISAELNFKEFGAKPKFLCHYSNLHPILHPWRTWKFKLGPVQLPFPIFTKFYTKPVQSQNFSTNFHQILHQPTPPFANWIWKCTWFRFSYVQSTSSLFPDRFSPNSTATLPFANWFWNCTWFRFRYMSKVQLPYSSTDFHQIRHRPYPLQTDFVNVPDSGLGMSRAQLPYFPTDFHRIWQQPYPLPTEFEIVTDFRCRTLQRITFLFLLRFSPNLTWTLPFGNWFLKCTWFQVQTCPRCNFFIPRTISTKLLYLLNHNIWDCTWWQGRGTREARWNWLVIS